MIVTAKVEASIGCGLTVSRIYGYDIDAVGFTEMMAGHIAARASEEFMWNIELVPKCDLVDRVVGTEAEIEVKAMGETFIFRKYL